MQGKRTHIEPGCDGQALEAEHEGDVRHHDPVARTRAHAGSDAHAEGLAVVQQAKAPHHFVNVVFLESEVANAARLGPIREAGDGHVEVFRVGALVPRHGGVRETFGGQDEEDCVGNCPGGTPPCSS